MTHPPERTAGHKPGRQAGQEPGRDAGQAEPQGDVLAPYRDEPIHLFIHDRVLRDQLKAILNALKFTFVTIHPIPPGYLDCARSLARHLTLQEGLFLVNPPAYAASGSAGQRVEKTPADFFEAVKLSMGKSRRDVTEFFSRCVPVMVDIQFLQKREKLLLELSHFGVAGAFILAKQDALGGLSDKLRAIRAKEQLMARFKELKEYLCEFLPHRQEHIDLVKERIEEKELTQRKAEAEQWMREGRKAKQAKDYERAVRAFMKAIEVYPGDPYAYLESGRVYVRLKRYPKALMRFSQAEEVAEQMPEPNKEIGMVRVLQVRELIATGEPPASPTVKQYMDEALEHFQRALDKAAGIAPLHEDDRDDRNVDAVTRIAGELMKLDVASFLGKTHPAAQRLGEITWDAYNSVSNTEADQLPGNQLIFLGLAAVNKRNFQEAERLFFKAAQSQEVFTKACDEIIYMGSLVRKTQGAEHAMGLYLKLLELDPPNKGAANFNLAVAFAAAGKELEAAGALVRGLMYEPALAQNAMFYKNHQLYAVLETVTELYEKAEGQRDRIPVLAITRKSVQLQEKLDRLILAGKDKDAFVLLYNLANKIPEFFENESVLADKTLVEFAANRVDFCKTAGKQNMVAFGRFLAEFLQRRKSSKYSKRLLAYLRFRNQALRELETTGNEAEAAFHFTKALVAHPEYLDSAEFYASDALMVFLEHIRYAMRFVDLEKVGA